MGKKPKKKAFDGRGFCTTSTPSTTKAKEKEEEKDEKEEAEDDADQVVPEAEQTNAASFAPPERGPAAEDGNAEEEAVAGWEAVAEAIEAGGELPEGPGGPAAAAAAKAAAAAAAEATEDAAEAAGGAGGNQGESIDDEVSRRIKEELERQATGQAAPSAVSRLLKATSIDKCATGKIVLNSQMEQRVMALILAEIAPSVEDAPPAAVDGEAAPRLGSSVPKLKLRFPPSYRLKVPSRARLFDRLYEAYKLLESYGFAQEHVRLGLEATSGLDIRAALEWLVLALPPAEVPTHLGGEGGAVVQLKVEEPSKQPQAEASSREEPAKSDAIEASPVASEGGSGGGEGGGESAGGGETGQGGAAAEESPSGQGADGGTSLGGNESSSKGGKAVDSDFNKRWLQQYADDGDSDGSDDSLEDPEVKLERKMRADPTGCYLQFKAEFEQLRRSAATLKAEKKHTLGSRLGDKVAEAKQVNDRMRKLKSDLEFLEKGKYGKLDQARVRASLLAAKPTPAAAAAAPVPVAQESSAADAAADSAGCEDKPKKGEEADEAEEQSFDVFGEDGATAQELQPSGPVDEVTGVIVREYTSKNWTGRKPKEILDDFVKKTLRLGHEAVKYQRLPRVRACRAQCSVFTSEPVVVAPVEGCKTDEEAAQLAATMALFELCQVRSQSTRAICGLLPPTYREFWRDRLDEYKLKQRELMQEQLQPRITFCVRLSRQLEEEGFFASGRAKASSSTAATATDRGAAPQDGKARGRGRGASVLPLPNVSMQERYEALGGDPTWEKMQDAKRRLPVWSMREELVTAIDFHDVVVVQGATGSGKTTQLPQFVLEAALARKEPINILVTEPRRLSAMTVAKRVSQELGDPHPGPGGKQSLSGYQIRMEKLAGPNCRMLFCTTGVALRKMQMDPELSDITHIFLDEIHERGAESDLLLLLLRKLITGPRRGALKVVLMSATVDTGKMAAYFEFVGVKAPVLSVPGRAYDVETLFLEDIIERSGFYPEDGSEYCLSSQTKRQQFTVSAGGGKTRTIVAETADPDWMNEALEDEAPGYSQATQRVIHAMDHNRINYDLLAATLEYIVHGGLPPAACPDDAGKAMPAERGAILVFLPGIAEINRAEKILAQHTEFCDTHLYKIIILHSSIQSEDTAGAFEPAPLGMRKIVLSTNIAETGVTIPDVVYVVDAGRVKQSKFHEATNTSSLTEQFITKAEAIQRRGRAGRVRPGVCVHLFTQKRFNHFSKNAVPELLRTALSELMLGLLSRGMPPSIFYEALDPPPKARVEQALQSLRVVGALAPPVRDTWEAEDVAGGADGENVVWRVRPLGRALARLPCDVRLGKMLIYGALLGGAPYEDVLTIAASLSAGKSPLQAPASEYVRADARQTHLRLFNEKEPSDHAVLCEAYRIFLKSKKVRAEDNMMREWYLSRATLEQIHHLRRELGESLASMGITSKLAKPLPQKWCFTAALLLAGLFPNVCRVDPPRKPTESKPQYLAAFSNEQVKLHPQSLTQTSDQHLHTTQLRWGVFHEKVKTSQVFLRDVTFLRPLALALFGGTSLEMQVHVLERAISVGGKDNLSVNVPPRHGAMLRQLRELVEQAVDRTVEMAEKGGWQKANGSREEVADEVDAASTRQALELLPDLLLAEATARS